MGLTQTQSTQGEGDDAVLSERENEEEERVVQSEEENDDGKNKEEGRGVVQNQYEEENDDGKKEEEGRAVGQNQSNEVNDDGNNGEEGRAVVQNQSEKVVKAPMKDGTVKDYDSDDIVSDVERMVKIASEVPDKIVKIVKSKRGNVRAKQPLYTIYTRRSKIRQQRIDEMHRFQKEFGSQFDYQGGFGSQIEQDNAIVEQTEGGADIPSEGGDEGGIYLSQINVGGTQMIT